MKFPNPPWNLFGACRSDELERLATTLYSARVPFEIKNNDPDEPKPYSIWVHDDHLQAASDAIGPIFPE